MDDKNASYIHVNFLWTSFIVFVCTTIVSVTKGDVLNYSCDETLHCQSYLHGSLHSVKDSCIYYFECLGEIRYQRACPPGTFFNHDTRQCSSDIECKIPCSHVTCGVFRSCDHNFLYERNSSDPRDCTKYYQCRRSEMYHMSCPNKEKFDFRQNICKHNLIALCDYCQSDHTPSPVATPIPDLNVKHTTKQTTSNPDPSTQEQTQPVTPVAEDKVHDEVNATNVDIFGNRHITKKDATSQTTPGAPEEVKTDPMTSVTSHSPTLGVNKDEDAELSTPKSEDSLELTTAVTGAMTSVTGQDTPTDPCHEPLQCSKHPSGSRHSSRDSCMYYFECQGDMKYELECPVGTYFDHDTRQCSSDVECKIPCSHEICGDLYGCTLNFLLQKNISDPRDCTKYFQCRTSEMYHMSCPNKYKYDSRTNICKPDLAAFCSKCKSDSFPTSDPDSNNEHTTKQTTPNLGPSTQHQTSAMQSTTETKPNDEETNVDRFGNKHITTDDQGITQTTAKTSEEAKRVTVTDPTNQKTTHMTEETSSELHVITSTKRPNSNQAMTSESTVNKDDDISTSELDKNLGQITTIADDSNAQTTEPPDPCLPNPCQNGGYCKNGADRYRLYSPGYHCLCRGKYAGKNCQLYDPCGPEPVGITPCPLHTRYCFITYDDNAKGRYCFDNRWFVIPE